MATSVSLNAVSYSIPATGDDSWGDQVSAYLIAIASATLQKSGGSFTLTADVDFGANFGLKSAYYKSRGTVSTAGVLRLANAESVGWRNQANGANLELTVNSSNVLTFNGAPVVTLALGTADYALKMNAAGTAYEWGQLANANIAAAAAIAVNKLAALTVSRAVVSDGSGFLAAATTTATEIGYVNGVTSAIQTQLDARQPLDADLTAIAGLTSAADKVPYFTGAGTADVATFTAAGRALVDDADNTAQRVTLGVVIGTDVQAYDAELAAIAGLTSAADKVPYFTGDGTADVATFTAAGRALVDDADATAQRTTLGLGNVDNTSDATKDAAAVSLTNKTIVAPIVTTSATFNAQAEARFADSDSTNYIGLKAPATVAADKVFILPNADGTANQVLKTDGSLGLGWASVLTDPLTAIGDIMHRDGANATTPLVIGTAGKFLKSAGGVPVWAREQTTSAQVDSYTVTDTDGITTVLMTSGASSRTVTLPTAADNSGRVITVKKVDSGAGSVVIDGEGAELINDATTFTMEFQWDWVTLVCDGTTWHSIAKQQVTPWTAATLAFTNDTPTGQELYTRRNGSSLEITGSLRWSGSSSGVAFMTVPYSLAALTDGFQNAGSGAGYWTTVSGGAFFGMLNVDTTTSLKFFASGASYTPDATQDYLAIQIEIPISTWGHWAK